MSRAKYALIGLLPLLCGPARAADDPCAASAWDVTQERALFRQAPEVVAAGKSPAKLPALTPGRLYELKLSAQQQVTFARPPGKKKQLPGAYAGLARLTVERGGAYRIAVGSPVWVDVAANGAFIEARDFHGRHGCDAPGKLVEFVLPAATALTLQFSASDAARLKVTVTRAPQPTP
jgi:hypothetical protein